MCNTRILLGKSEQANTNHIKITSDNVQHGALPVSDFFEALSFEKSNSIMAQNALPETLKRACLRAVQFCELPAEKIFDYTLLI
jgi:hypothetical protein